MSYNKYLSIYKTSCYSSLFIEDLFDYLTIRRKCYDYILIDLEGSTSGPTSIVLAHTNRAIVTFRASGLSPTVPLGKALSSIARAKYNGNAALDVDFMIMQLGETTSQVKRWRAFLDQYGAFTSPFYTVDTTYQNEAVIQGKVFADVRRNHQNTLAYRKIAEKLFFCTPPKLQRSILTRKKQRDLLNERVEHSE